MSLINIEIKAKSANQETIRDILKSKKANFKGIDHQIDTYFNVNSGRLKLREGGIEPRLVYYKREDKAGPKQADVNLFEVQDTASLKEILKNALGILIVVDKQREIYFIDNVKFHIDTVNNLGTFIEIEAQGENKSENDKLLGQCQKYLQLFKISDNELVSVSYSDLLLQKKHA